MIEDSNKNLKNSISDMPTFSKGLSLVSYSKTDKLITALYMVTDVMDRDEPLRNKLRSLGVNIISDTNSTSLRTSINKSINEVLSLLDIAFTVGMISDMNCSILKKEFNKLKQSVEEPNQSQLSGRQVSLSGFFTEEDDSSVVEDNGQQEDVHYISNKFSNRIGVQKGSTLMSALSKFQTSNKVSQTYNKNNFTSRSEGFNRNTSPSMSGNFDALKKQRRESISKIIKANPISGGDKSLGHSIKDIMSALKNSGEECGEKTLQRELVSMVNDGVLKKTGEKRWSKYFLK